MPLRSSTTPDELRCFECQFRCPICGEFSFGDHLTCGVCGAIWEYEAFMIGSSAWQAYLGIGVVLGFCSAAVGCFAVGVPWHLAVRASLFLVSAVLGIVGGVLLIRIAPLARWATRNSGHLRPWETRWRVRERSEHGSS